MLPIIWEKRFTRLLYLGVTSIVGIFLLGLIFLTDLESSGWLIAITVLMIAPGIIYTVIITHLHWKARYRGKHSDLWGVLLVVETSGWFKLVYIFRHILPDARGTGRYARLKEEAADLSASSSEV